MSGHFKLKKLMIKVETFEHCVDNVVVSQRVVKLFGLPIYTRYTETSNYNYVGQFDANNFTNNNTEEKKNASLYTETHIGFTNEENEETTKGDNSESK